jgi:hypothetical protein
LGKKLKRKVEEMEMMILIEGLGIRKNAVRYYNEIMMIWK